MMHSDLYEDEVMRDIWKRKAEASMQSIEEEKDPHLRDERRAKWIAEGVRFVSTEDVLRRKRAVMMR